MKKTCQIASPIVNSLTESKTVFDNEILEAMGQLGVMSIFASLKIKKRSGESKLPQIVYALLIMPLLSVSNVYCFAGKFLDIYIPGGKDVLYDFMSRQDINWYLIALRLAKKVIGLNVCFAPEDLAFVVDDTIKKRRGKKVQAMSSHYDHNEGRSVMGQQILQLGLASPKCFIPLLSQIFVGKERRTKRSVEFKDKRKAVARSYQAAHNQTKHQMLAGMIKTAISEGVHAAYIVADSWFGCKSNIALALKHELTAIYMMKRNRTKYRYLGKDYTLKGLYRAFRKSSQAHPHKRFRYFTLVVGYNLAESHEPENFIKVKLVFSWAKGAKSNSWVVLLCTDYLLEDHKIYEIYALRWSVECYFKEIKQNLGFLKEQTGKYETHYASIHLAAMRYLLLTHIYLRQNKMGFTKLRDQLRDKIELLSFGLLSWSFIAPIVYQTIEQKCQGLDSEFARALIEEIEKNVTQRLFNSLQISPESIELRNKAEKLGHL